MSLKPPLYITAADAANGLQLSPTLCDPIVCSHQDSRSTGFSRQVYWRGLPWTPPGDLPDPGIEPVSPLSPALAGGLFVPGATWETPPSILAAAKCHLLVGRISN